MPKPEGGQQASRWPKISKKQKLKSHLILGEQHMFLVPGVLTVPEAQAFIDAAERVGFQHQGSRGAAYGEAFRDNHRISFEDPALAQQLWEQGGLAAKFEGVLVDGERAVGLNPNIRIYRYTTKQKFGKHIDDCVEVAPGRVTRYTLLVYLSGRDPSSGSSGIGGTSSSSAAIAPDASTSSGGSGQRTSKRVAGKQQQQQQQHQQQQALAAPCTSAVQPLKGGETVFYGDRNRVLASVAPQPGLALLHLHGEDRCLEHEAAAVIAGTKYVLRSDVVFGAS